MECGERCSVPHEMLLPINLATLPITKPMIGNIVSFSERGRGVEDRGGQMGWQETRERQSDWGQVERNLSHQR